MKNILYKNFHKSSFMIHSKYSTINVKQKKKLVSSTKGISYDIIHELFSKNTKPMSCVYLISLNTVKSLRKNMNIDDKYDDNDLVYKYGLTKSFGTRAYNHKSEFKNVLDIIDLNLVLYTHIDPLYLYEAEKMISDNVSDMKLYYDNHKELIIIPKPHFKNIKLLFKQIGTTFSGHTTELNNKISNLNNIIDNLNLQLETKNNYIKSITDQHKLQKEVYKANLKAFRHELQYQNILIKQK